eukprot:5760110-Pleurochrysis_carterae.AAC.4
MNKNSKITYQRPTTTLAMNMERYIKRVEGSASGFQQSEPKKAWQSALCGMYSCAPEPTDWYCQELAIGRIGSPRIGARSVWIHNKENGISCWPQGCHRTP